MTIENTSKSNLRHLEVLKVLYKKNCYSFKIQFAAASQLFFNFQFLKTEFCEFSAQFSFFQF